MLTILVWCCCSTSLLLFLLQAPRPAPAPLPAEPPAAPAPVPAPAPPPALPPAPVRGAYSREIAAIIKVWWVSCQVQVPLWPLVCAEIIISCNRLQQLCPAAEWRMRVDSNHGCRAVAFAAAPAFAPAAVAATLPSLLPWCCRRPGPAQKAPFPAPGCPLPPRPLASSPGHPPFSISTPRQPLAPTLSSSRDHPTSRPPASATRTRTS